VERLPQIEGGADRDQRSRRQIPVHLRRRSGLSAELSPIPTKDQEGLWDIRQKGRSRLRKPHQIREEMDASRPKSRRFFLGGGGFRAGFVGAGRRKRPKLAAAGCCCCNNYGDGIKKGESEAQED
jgi:hypothetical protein